MVHCSRRIVAAAIFLYCIGVSACVDSTTEPTCVPDRENWDAAVKDIVSVHCGQCHSQPTDFGAPYALVDYDALIQGKHGERPVDRMVELLKAGEMPPPPRPKPNHADFDSMILWASCGLEHPDYQDGLQSSAPIFFPEGGTLQDASTWEIRAGGFAVKPNYIDRYQCFALEVPVTEPSLIRRIEMVVDESRVLHHVVLYRDTEHAYDGRNQFRCTGTPGNSDFLYSWAPGQDAIQFESGGLVMTPGERYILQIHYNNAAGISGVEDNSGVRVFYETQTDDVPAYSMFVPGPNLFLVPPQSYLSVSGYCNITDEITLFAGMPHMHELGRDFSSEIVRSDGSTESIIELTGWSFEAQLFYKYDTKLYPGDQLKTTCGFYNDSETEFVLFGSNTSEEMCFNFAYVTPPIDRRFCNDDQSFAK